MLGEALELPRIEPKGTDETRLAVGALHGISTSGPESLRHFKRSYRQALRRLIVSGTYDPTNPRVSLAARRPALPHLEAAAPSRRPNAAIIYVMDVSGSMGDEQKEIVRTESFWLDAWIRSHYQGVRTVYIVHDAAAKEVDRETFFTLRESGGTVISSAYELVLRASSRSASRRRIGTSTCSTSPTARTTAVRTPTSRRTCSRGEAASRGQPLRLRPGRGVGHAGRFHRRPALALRGRRARRALADPRPRRHRRFDQRLPRTRALARCRARCPSSCSASRSASRRSPARWGSRSSASSSRWSTGGR